MASPRSRSHIDASKSKRIRPMYMIAITATIISFAYYYISITTWLSIIENTQNEENEAQTDILQHIPSEEKELQLVPPATEIESILQEEQRRIHGDNLTEDAKVRLHSLAQTYAMTYKLIHELQKQNINVTLTFGSHLGALRHHGVIPFEEKDVDLAVFSTDVSKIKRAIRTTLAAQQLDLTFDEQDFGFQIPATKDLHTYIDIWMFKSDASKTTTCVGHQQENKSCKSWYRTFHAKLPPVYRYDAWFPFRSELFGTERVPIPATNIPIESFHFDNGGPNFWNTTCGPDRRWIDDKWVNVEMTERKCSDKYDAHPFVFLKENGTEQLRQGSVVIHEVAGVGM